MQQTTYQSGDSLVSSPRSISEVLAAHTPEWMKLAGVIGTGETRKDGKPVILIFVDAISNDAKAKLPQLVEGYAVVIEDVGQVRAY